MLGLLQPLLGVVGLGGDVENGLPFSKAQNSQEAIKNVEYLQRQVEDLLARTRSVTQSDLKAMKADPGTYHAGRFLLAAGVAADLVSCSRRCRDILRILRSDPYADFVAIDQCLAAYMAAVKQIQDLEPVMWSTAGTWLYAETDKIHQKFALQKEIMGKLIQQHT